MQKYFISSLLVAMLIVVAFVNTPSAHAAPEFQNNYIFPITMGADVPCLNHGQGDVLTLSGNFHLVQMVNVDNGGGSLLNYHFNTQGLTGVSQATGQKYQGIDTQADIQNARVGEILNAEVMWRFIGQGTSTDLLAVHAVVHITFNPDGTIAIHADNISFGCLNH